MGADEGRWPSQTIERLRLGLDFTGRDYAEAMRAREAWRRVAEGAFAEVDLILSPTVPVATPWIEDGRSLFETTRSVTRNTYAGAFGGYPGLSLPCGQTGDGMPIGVQIEAGWWQEPLLLRAGVAYQRTTDWHLRRPQMKRP
jgi:aspartyl-tRNA(Asn)/glutamyl-tRNA(Gln) amidotransferase subunit A